MLNFLQWTTLWILYVNAVFSFFFFIFKHPRAVKRSWKIHGGPGKSQKSPGFFVSKRVGTMSHRKWWNSVRSFTRHGKSWKMIAKSQNFNNYLHKLSYVIKTNDSQITYNRGQLAASFNKQPIFCCRQSWIVAQSATITNSVPIAYRSV